MNTTRTYFGNLDKLRFLSFLWVFCWHCFGYFETGYFGMTDHAVIKFLAGVGYLGVNFFFVLSGFLITWLLLEEKKNNGQVNILNFYLRRVLRIWPLYFAIVIIGFFLMPIVSGNTHIIPEQLSHFWKYLFFWANFDRIETGYTGIGNDNLGVLWSVAVEEQFYLVWPILIYFSKKSGQLLIILCVIITSLIFRYYHINQQDQLYFHTFSVMGDLGIGALLAWLYMYFPSQIQRSVSFLKYKTPVFIIQILLVSLVVLYKNFLQSSEAVIFERIVFSLVFGYILLLNIFSSDIQSNFIARWMTEGGKITYGLYCFNLLVIGITQKIFLILSNQTGITDFPGIFYLEAITALVLTIVICKLSFRYLETPFLKLKDRIKSRVFPA